MTSFLNDAVRKAHRQQNTLHTILLLVGLTLLLALPTWLIFGTIGLVVVAGFVLALSFGAPRISPDMVMRAYSAVELTAQKSPQLVHVVSALAQRAELERAPRLYVIPSLALNAFATGTRDHAAIAITEGLLRKLDTREVAGVLAHEVSHIRNNDLRVMMLADVISRVVQLMSYFALGFVILNVLTIMTDGEPYVPWIAILILYFAPLITSLLQLGLSRAREYDADLEAAHLTGDPSWLASALRDLETHEGRFWDDLLYPVPGRRIPQPSVLRSHPSTADRIARLAALDARLALPTIDVREEPFISMIGGGPKSMRPRYRFPGIWY